MKPAALRLVVTAVLFIGWIGYLAYLAVTARNPVVLSRPQFLVSGLDVIAHPAADGGPACVIDEVLYPASRKEELQGTTIEVQNLVHCQVPANGGWIQDAKQFAKDRRFLMPLQSPHEPPKNPADDKLQFAVVPIPPSPGFPPADSQRTAVGPARVYPDTPGVRSEYAALPKSR